MNSHWLRIQFYPENDTKENREKIVSIIIKELIAKLGDTKEKFNFYFSYQQGYVLLYVLIKDIGVHLIPLLNEAKAANDLIANCEWKEDDQKGNIDFYKEGWDLTTIFLEAISRLMMDFIIKKQDVERDALLFKYVHLLLNAVGYNWQQESQFHHLAALNMLVNCYDLSNSELQKLGKEINTYTESFNELSNTMSKIRSERIIKDEILS